MTALHRNHRKDYVSRYVHTLAAELVSRTADRIERMEHVRSKRTPTTDMPPVPSVTRTPADSTDAEEVNINAATDPIQSTPASSQPRRSLPNIFGGAFGRSSADARKAQSPSRRTSEPPNNPSPAASSIPLGHEGNLSDEQKKILDSFTNELVAAKVISIENAPPYQTTQLLRFLRARNFDLKASKEMYLRAEDWKKSVDLDRLYEEFEFTERAAVSEYGWRMYFHKTDLQGRPIFIQDLSGLDTEKVFSVTTAERIVQNFAVTLEHAVRHRYLACTNVKGETVDDNLMVLNVQGLGLSTFWTMKNKLQELLSILDNNFPELSGRVQIINAPLLFSTVWSCIKGWLPTQTAEKIDISGSDYMPTISALVNMENWPKHLGGKCTCGAKESRPSCETSDNGPWPKQKGF